MRRLGLAAVLAGVVACSGGGSSGGGGGPTVEPPDSGVAPGMDFSVRPDPAGPVHDDTVVHQADLMMADADWQSIIDDSRGDDERHATLTYDGVVIPEVGVHPSGESSRFPGNQKQSIRVKFDAFPTTGKFAGLSEINIKGEYDDHSMMRERLAYFVFRSVMPTPQAAAVRLTVNGQLRGLYTIREVWDAASIKNHFTEPLGPLYRIRGFNGEDPYLYKGPDATAYMPHPWEAHIDHPSRGDDVIGSFLNVVNNTPAMLDQVADVEDLLDYLGVAATVMITDGFVGDTGVADHFQYFDPQSGKFFILPWDPDNSFASQNEMPNRSITKNFGLNKLAILFRDTADLKTRYKAKIASIMAAMPAAMVQAQADHIYQQIQQAAYEDPFKAFTNSDFDWSLGYLKDFISMRYAYLATQVP